LCEEAKMKTIVIFQDSNGDVENRMLVAEDMIKQLRVKLGHTMEFKILQDSRFASYTVVAVKRNAVSHEHGTTNEVTLRKGMVQ